MQRLLRIAVIAAFTVAVPMVAGAFPQLALRPGGTPFEGPADPEVSALWWNPAALAQQRGWRLFGSGQLLLSRGSVARDSICSSTGAAGGCADRGFSETPIADLGWGGFAGTTWDFRTENLTIGFGVMLPWEQHRALAGATTAAAGSGELPVAYHLRSEDFRALYFTLGLGVKVNQKFAIGASASVVDTWASYSFDRDTALDGGSARFQAAGGYERAAYASTVTAYADGGNFWRVMPAPTGLGLSVGAIFEPTGGVMLGASWTRMFPFYGQEGRFAISRAVDTRVLPPSVAGAVCGTTDAGGTAACKGGATLIFDIPDVWQAGLRWTLPRYVELSTWGRVVVYGPYANGAPSSGALVVQLTGAPVDTAVAPSRIVLARGLRPAFAGELGVRWWAVPPDLKSGRVASLRLGASAIVESSAVPADLVTAADIDAPKIDAMVAAELHLRWFRLMAGYEFTGLIFTSLNAASPGAFNPAAATSCADARYALESCGDALSGRALPSSAGHYSLQSHRFSVALGKDF